MATRFARLLLVCSWLFALVGLVYISVKYTGPATHFYGIADDHEQTIRFAGAVEVVRYGFVSGQEVNVGDLLLEVRQPELQAELLFTREQIHALRFDKEDARSSMRTDLEQARAELQGALVTSDDEKRALQARQKSLDALFGQMGSAASTEVAAAIAKQLQSVDARRRAIRRSAEAGIEELTNKLTTAERPVDGRIAEFEKRMSELERQQATSRVVAQIDGRVGDVLFAPGETVPPYQPIVTIHGTQPSFVKGYIHESVINNVATAQTVWVRPLSPAQGDWREGTVASLGSRIVEFPQRLRINSLSQAWGREVVVSLPRDNGLMLGEKVDIQLQPANPLQAGFELLVAELKK